MAELEGLDAMLAALRAVAMRVEAATPDGLAAAGDHLEAKVKELLSLTSHPPGTPTPSGPGQPPSLVSGNLRRSVQTEGPTPSGPGRWTLQVGADTAYARIQEYGGTAGHGATLPARPYMAPALAAALPDMAAAMEDAWGQALTT